LLILIVSFCCCCGGGGGGGLWLCISYSIFCALKSIKKKTF